MLIILFGLPGCGKTTIGKLLSEEIDSGFYDMDDTLPANLREKMKNNELISEEERREYIESVISDLKELTKENSAVASCVLVKEDVQEMMSEAFPDAEFISMECSDEVLRSRVGGRGEHFFKGEILEKLLAVKKPIKITHKSVDADKPVEQVLASIKEILNP